MTISIIIPTLNEVENIAQLITFIQGLERNEIVEILVVDGGSDDGTCELAQKSGAKVIASRHRSRASQMNLGALHARGDILYFVHADVKLVPTFVDDIIKFSTQGFESGCYRYIFNSDKFLLKVNAYFTRFDALMCRGGDQTLYVMKSVFISLGGFDEAYTIMEDYDFIVRLRKEYRFKIIQKDIVVSARKYDTNSWFRVQIANLLIFTMFFFRRSPDEMKQIYKILLTYR